MQTATAHFSLSRFLLLFSSHPVLVNCLSFTKMKTRETAYTRAQNSILMSSGISIRETSKILQRSERWVTKWTGREDFEDKPRTGRPAVLNRTNKALIEKAKYKGGNSTRKIPDSYRANAWLVLQYQCGDTRKYKKQDRHLSDVKRNHF